MEQPPSFDRDVALERLGGDEELFVEIIELFLEDLPRLREGIRQSLQEGDTPTLCREAHSLKGSAANIGGTGVQEISLELEKLARAGEMDSAKEACVRLESEVEKLVEHLNEYIAHPA